MITSQIINGKKKCEKCGQFKTFPCFKFIGKKKTTKINKYKVKGQRRSSVCLNCNPKQ